MRGRRDARFTIATVISIAWLAIGCDRHPMTGPIASTRADLEQAYAQLEPALAGHQRAEGVVVDGDGITVLASANPHGDVEHTWVLRLALDGKLSWERHYVPAYGAGRAISAVPSGGFVIGGDVRRAAMAYQGTLLRIDRAGETMSFASLGPRGVTGVYAVQAGSAGAIAAGGTARWKGWLVSTDAALDNPREAAVEADELHRLAVLPDGDAVVLASVEKSTTWFGRARVARVASDGTVRWQRLLPSSGHGDPASLVPVADGGWLAVGTGALAEQDASQLWLVRLDASGQLTGEHTVRAADAAASARASCVYPDGQIGVAGQLARADGTRTPHLWRLAANGTVRWDHGYGADGDHVTGMAALADGGAILVGSTPQGAGKTNVWVVRVAADGAVVWQRVFGAPAS